MPTTLPRFADSYIPTHSEQTKINHRRRRVWTVVVYLALSSATGFFLLALLRSGLAPTLKTHRIGRQSQDSIGKPVGLDAEHASPATTPSSSHNTSTAAALPLLPPHIWNPFVQDPAPLTHLTVQSCFLPPWLFITMCAPKETPAEIAQFGKWIRVPRDIGLKNSRKYIEIYYRRSSTLTSPFAIRDIRVIEDSMIENPVVAHELRLGKWEKVGSNIREDLSLSNQAPAHIWITRDPEAGIGAEGGQGPLTEVDIIWGHPGEVKPWWNFYRVDDFLFGGKNDTSRLPLSLTIRRSVDTSTLIINKPNLVFNSKGSFKILQIADLHFSVGAGVCHDASVLSQCKQKGADLSTIEWLSLVLDKLSPDLVVFSGDQLNGQGTSWDDLSVLLKVGHLIADRGLAWTAILGNHDSEDKGLDRVSQMLVMSEMPGFVGTVGPADDHMGAGNYVLPIKSGKEQNEELFTLFFLDSHAYSQTSLSSLWGSVTGAQVDYDWIKPVQSSWFRGVASNVSSLLRPFTGSAHLDNSTFGLWPSGGLQPRQMSRLNTLSRQRRRLSTPSHQQQTLRKPNAILFQHIPLPEAYDAADKDIKTGGELVFGHRLEGPKAPKRKNSHFFEDGILNVTETGEKGDAPQVKIIANGHAHVTDECRKVKGVYHCFAGGSSYSTYGRDVFERRVRVYNIQDWGETIETWKILNPRVVVTNNTAGGGVKTQWEQVTLVGKGSVGST